MSVCECRHLRNTEVCKFFAMQPGVREQQQVGPVEVISTTWNASGMVGGL